MTDVQHLTIEILKQIRDEVRGTNARVDGLNGRVDELRLELHATREDLSGRIDQTNARLDKVEGTLLDLAQQQAFLVRAAKRSAMREKAYGRDIEDLKDRVGKLESTLATKDS
jgi:chromosome segregation ATPase